jgi:predicted permease
MRRLRGILVRVASQLRGHRANDDFDAELESHIAMHTDDGMRTGLSLEEARRQALVRLGGADQTRQAWRERRGLPWIESPLRDLHYGVRTLRKHPGITAIAMLSIGLGIGANATIFSIVSRFVLRPAPVGSPSTLMSLRVRHEGSPCCDEFSLPLYTDFHEEAKSFSDVAAYFEVVPASISGSGEPERVWGQAVTPNFFSVLQLPMILGRGFVSGEENQPVILLGARLWQRRFHADPAIIGKTILLSGRTFTVVGIVPPGFHSVDQLLNGEFWVPLGNAAQLVPGLGNQTSREFTWLAVAARLKPDVTPEQASMEIQTLGKRLALAYPKAYKESSFVLEQAGTLPQGIKSQVLIFLTVLLVVVLLVLAIAGANVANLLFAQAATRQREMAVRLALGATRVRLCRQMLVESVLLGLGGGVLGTVLSLWATRSLSAFHLPIPVPVDLSVAVDGRVLLYAFVLSVFSGLLLGLPPAWAASRHTLVNAIKGEDALARPGRRRLTLRNFLTISQVAMTLVLLCPTLLFLRSLQGAARISIGFRPERLLTLSVDPRLHGYTAERTVQFLEELRSRAAVLPGVVSVDCTDYAPLSLGHRAESFHVNGAVETGNQEPIADLYMVTPSYFETMGIPLIAGLRFGEETATGPRIAVVNQAFAERLFHGQNPVGQQVIGAGVTYQIVGVSGNVRSRTLGEDIRPVLYRSLRQSVGGDPSLFGYTLLVHTAAESNAISEGVNRQVHALDPSIAIFNEETMEEHVRSAYFLPRLAATLFGVFGGIGLVLATIGLYGVMSYAVSRRTREIGIRMAVGAEPGMVERLVLHQGMVLTLIAIALGWPVAWMLAKLAASFLYGVQAHDALTFAAVPIFLAVIAFFACWVPARRAAMVDPVQALRAE